LIAGFVERWPSAALMRLADVQLSFPFILLAMTINAIVGLGLRNIILSLSAAGWVVYARVVRGGVLAVKERDFVQAVAALVVGGAGTDGAWREPARRLAPRHPRSEASRLTEALCAPSSAPSPSFSSSSPSPLPRSPRTGSRARRS